MSEKRLAFGIDLGTTNSAISVVASGTKPEIITYKDINNKVRSTVPSCVMWNGGENFVVGEEAYVNFEKENVAHSFKKLMGSNEAVTLEYNGEKRDFSPEELSSKVLARLCEIAKPLYGEVKDVVITVPAYFTDDQVTATRRAGEMIGLNVLSTFREPVASALVYVSEYADRMDSATERVMVYDLGGGTFDVSVVDVHKVMDHSALDQFYGFESKESEEGESAGITLNVKGKYGDMKLGGDDVDHYLLEILLDKVERAGVDTENIARTCERELLHFCEEFKKGYNMGMLSVKRGVSIKYKNGTQAESVNVEMTADDLHKAVFSVYKRTQSEEAQEIIAEASQGRLDGILLIGGSTKSTFLEEFLRDSYPGIPINKSLSPDEAVCLGAGLQASRLVNGIKGVTINDVLPLPIGVLADGRISKILSKDIRVPTIAHRYYHTVVDDQELLNVDVYQGNSIFPEDSHYIGRLTIDDLPKGKAGSFAIHVQLSVNVDGVLNCSVKIGDKTRSIELTNVFKGSDNTDSAKPDNKEEKHIKRFLKLAEVDPNGEAIKAAIDDYYNGKIEFKELFKKVNSLRSRLNIRGGK